MHQTSIARDLATQCAALEDTQHGSIALQDVGNDLLQAGLAANGNKVAHERLADALPLAFIRHEEGRFSPPGFHDDVAASTHDYSTATFLHRNESYVTDEVDVQKIVELFLGETTLWGKEAAVARLIAAAVQCGQQTVPVFRPKCAYFDDLATGNRSATEYFAACMWRFPTHAPCALNGRRRSGVISPFTSEEAGHSLLPAREPEGNHEDNRDYEHEREHHPDHVNVRRTLLQEEGGDRVKERQKFFNELVEHGRPDVRRERSVARGLAGRELG